MSIILNAKREVFAQALADGKSQFEAHGLAGFKAHTGNASKLAQDERIVERVTEIVAEKQAAHAGAIERAVEHHGITIEGLIADALRIERAAFDDKQFGAANAALISKAKLAGKWIERSEVGRPGEFEEMSEEQLRAYIAEQTEALGFGFGNAKLN